MRVAFLVFYLLVLVVALATEGEGTDIPRDECIVWRNKEKRIRTTLKDGLDVLLSKRDLQNLNVEVTHSNHQTCSFKGNDKQNIWVKSKIEMANSISIPGDTNLERTGQCEVKNQQSTNITLKTVTIEGLSVVGCNDGPAVFMASPNMTMDFISIPWYNGSINLTMTPLADTPIKITIQDQPYDINGTKRTPISVRVSQNHFSYKETGGTRITKDTTVEKGGKVKVHKSVLKGLVIIRQFFGSPAPKSLSQEEGISHSATTATSATSEAVHPVTPTEESSAFLGSAASPWVFAGIPAAGLVGLIIGALLQYYLQSPKKTSAADQAAAPTESGVVSVTNDMYEPLEEYRRCAGSGHTAAGSGPVRNDEGGNEVINSLYEPFDEMWARSRQEN